MFTNPELYNKCNILPRRDALQCLEEYAKEMKWKKDGSTVIDVGCGDGSVTSILKTFIPKNCKELVGCDINEKMIEFAEANYAKDFIRFMVLDIEGDLPDQLREKFDHVFSFYTLNWIPHHKKAFSNIYDLLERGGECLLTLMNQMPLLYDAWVELARSPRWKPWGKDANLSVSPYQDSQDPEKEVETIMTSIGFTDVKVKYVDKVFIFPEEEVFKGIINAISLFKIPPEMQEDFGEDFLKVVRDMQPVDDTSINIDGTLNVKLNYKHIIAYGKK